MTFERPLSQETKRFIINTMKRDQDMIQYDSDYDESAWEFKAEINSIIEATEYPDATWESVLEAASNVGHREDWLTWLRTGK